MLKYIILRIDQVSLKSKGYDLEKILNFFFKIYLCTVYNFKYMVFLVLESYILTGIVIAWVVFPQLPILCHQVF
jgi:hypothetical protein